MAYPYTYLYLPLQGNLLASAHVKHRNFGFPPFFDVLNSDLVFAVPLTHTGLYVEISEDN